MNVSLRKEKKIHWLNVTASNQVAFEEPVSPSKLKDGFYVKVSHNLIDTLDLKSQELIRNEDRNYSYQIMIAIYAGKDPANNYDPQKVVYTKVKNVSINGNHQIVISWDQEDIVAWKKLFPFTEAMRILGNDMKLKLSDVMTEIYGIYALAGKNGAYGGWLFYPKKTIDYDNPTSDFEKLVYCIANYGKHQHLDLKEKKGTESSKKRNHGAKIEKSTEWMDAEEYNGDITTWQNCIYTLASDPDENGICKVYIGEATNPLSTKKTRIGLQKVDGKIYIDHTKKEAKEHRFTRFRIDKLKDSSSEYLHDTQDTAIGIAYMLRRECPKGYVMTNEAQAASFNKAIEEDLKKNGDR